jgi:hypothetical protein
MRHSAAHGLASFAHFLHEETPRIPPIAARAIAGLIQARRVEKPTGPGLPAEEPRGLINDFRQAVDFRGRVVEVEARAGGRGDPQFAPERLGAVVAAAERNSLPVGEGHDIVGMSAGQAEAD